MKERPMVKGGVSAQGVCEHCGREGCHGPSNLEIAIRKGHVRRASRAADGVVHAAASPSGAEHGVVFMTAILLIERLAAAYSCEPRLILHKIAECFDLKHDHLRSDRHCN